MPTRPPGAPGRCGLVAALLLCSLAPALAGEGRSRLAGQFDRGDRFALLVGVNDFKDERLSDLRFCVNDMLLLADVLEKRCAYPAANITLLVDGQPADRLPTRENVLRHLHAMLLETKAGDTVLVAFACHGGTEGGGSNLCAADFDTKNPGLTGVRVEHVRDAMHSSDATQKLLIIDACHSGAVKGSGPTLGLSGEDLEGSKGAGGLITFAAARRHQESQEDGEKRHGLFTYALAQGLGGKADTDGDGIVDSDEIYRYVHDSVGDMARERGHEQTPVRIIGEDVTGVLALARVTGEADLVRDVKTGERIENAVGMPLVLVMPGAFAIGSPPDEAERNENEYRTGVRLARPFLIGATEVTQGEYERVTGTNPSYYQPGGEGAEAVADLDASRLPVEQVTWDEAVQFCSRLSALPEEQAAGRSYRLPREAEWEYGCRAGTTTAFATGALLDPTQANVDGKKPYLDAEEVAGLRRTAPVGSYAPNAWGLLDMHGNVAEWCADFYVSDRSSATAISDPTTHPVKGGAFLGRVGQSRAAARTPRKPDFRHRTIGFRVVCEAADLKHR